MKWLEGWFGTASGVMGALLIVVVTLLTPAYPQTQSCSSYDGGPVTCKTSYGPGMPPSVSTGPQPALLILIGVVFLLFILVLVGTWVDLSGRRTTGRLILLISVSLLTLAWWLTLLAAAGGGVPLAVITPAVALAIIAGILACVRRDRSAAA